MHFHANSLGSSPTKLNFIYAFAWFYKLINFYNDMQQLKVVSIIFWLPSEFISREFHLCRYFYNDNVCASAEKSFQIFIINFRVHLNWIAEFHMNMCVGYSLFSATKQNRLPINAASMIFKSFIFQFGLEWVMTHTHHRRKNVYNIFFLR